MKQYFSSLLQFNKTRLHKANSVDCGALRKMYEFQREHYQIRFLGNARSKAGRNRHKTVSGHEFADAVDFHKKEIGAGMPQKMDLYNLIHSLQFGGKKPVALISRLFVLVSSESLEMGLVQIG